MNKLDEAALQLNRAIKLRKRSNYEPHYLLSLVRLRQGDDQKAIIEAKRAAKLKPGFAPAYKALSEAYLMKGDYANAEKALLRYLDRVRNKTEAAILKERLTGIRILARARPEASVQKPITRPKIHRIPRPLYTDEARRYKVEGAVRVEALFGTDGTIRHAFVVRGLGFGLDEAALKAAQGIDFDPGEIDGQPAPMWISVSIIFAITEEEIKAKDDPKIALLNY
jgi:TonB family protein